MVVFNQIISNYFSIFPIEVLADDILFVRERIRYDIFLEIDTVKCHFEKENVL